MPKAKEFTCNDPRQTWSPGEVLPRSGGARSEHPCVSIACRVERLLGSNRHESPQNPQDVIRAEEANIVCSPLHVGLALFAS